MNSCTHDGGITDDGEPSHVTSDGICKDCGQRVWFRAGIDEIPDAPCCKELKEEIRVMESQIESLHVDNNRLEDLVSDLTAEINGLERELPR